MPCILLVVSLDPKVSVCACASSSVARMQPARTKLFDRDFVRGVITEAVQALGYRLPTREQLLVTEQFVSGRDVFVSLPTGSGKSVCYGCLPLVFDRLRDDGDHHSIVVVVAPLSALMTDQVSSFNVRGLKASCVGVNICSKDQPTCEDIYGKV